MLIWGPPGKPLNVMGASSVKIILLLLLLSLSSLLLLLLLLFQMNPLNLNQGKKVNHNKQLIDH